MRRAVLCLLCVLCLCGPARAEELTEEKRRDVERYLELSGNRALAQQMLQAYVKQSVGWVKKMRPDIPPASMPAVERDLSAFLAERVGGKGGLMEQLAPVFAKHFSHDEVRQLLAFYESPVGRKAVGLMPRLVKEGGDVAQRMGIGLIPELNRRVNEVLERERQRTGGQGQRSPRPRGLSPARRSSAAGPGRRASGPPARP